MASDSTPETNILIVILVMWLLSLYSLFQKKWIRIFYEHKFLSNNQNETMNSEQHQFLILKDQGDKKELKN